MMSSCFGLLLCDPGPGISPSVSGLPDRGLGLLLRKWALLLAPGQLHADSVALCMQMTSHCSVAQTAGIKSCSLMLFHHVLSAVKTFWPQAGQLCGRQISVGLSASH